MILAPAPYFGLAWGPAERQPPAPDGRPKALFTSALTLAFEDAMRSEARVALMRAGFCILGDGPRGRGMIFLAEGYDVAALEAVVAEAEVAAVPVREARLAAEETRRVAAAARFLVQCRETAERGRVALATIAWSMSADDRAGVERAVAVQPEEWTRSEIGAVNVAVQRGAQRIAQARKVLRRAHGPELACALEPEVRAAALEAVRHVSRLDEDMAREANGRGWDALCSALGHVLAAEDSLDATHASHALRILRRHMRQVPPTLAARLVARAAA